MRDFVFAEAPHDDQAIGKAFAEVMALLDSDANFLHANLQT